MHDDFSVFSNRVIELQAYFTPLWHTDPLASPQPCTELETLIVKQHRFNFNLWHEEDKAREPGVSDAHIADVKRNIDALNQKRNDAFTEIDEVLASEVFSQLQPDPDLPWNSETIGSIVDRLSIASLKVYHMQEQVERDDASSEHKDSCRQKVAKLKAQLTDLATALQIFFDEVLAGRKQNKLYHQFKMYNDPSLNPKLYQSAETDSQ